jgi:hypothetical protein
VPAHRAAAPPAFAHAVKSLRDLRPLSHVRIGEAPAPSRVAPFSIALTAEVTDDDDELASGRFILLHDPAGQEAWQGTMRVVTFAQATLETELGEDPMLCDIGWSWLTEQLRPCPHTARGGTVTRVLSASYDAMSSRPGTAEIEIRASWSPLGTDITDHFQAWSAMLCTIAGLPPLPDGVSALPATARSHPRC